MKNRSKALGLLLAAVLLVTASVFGTIAYLKATTEKVANTFTVGKVAINLDESKYDATTGELDTATRVKKNAYKILPAGVYKKDPTVTVLSGSDSAYIRVKLTVTHADKLAAAIGKENIYKMFDVKSDWTVVDANPALTGTSIVYELRYKEPVAALTGDVKLASVFSQVTVPASIDNTQLAALNEMEISLVAEAIQAQGLATATAAWNAFDGK